VGSIVFLREGGVASDAQRGQRYHVLFSERHKKYVQLSAKAQSKTPQDPKLNIAS